MAENQAVVEEANEADVVEESGKDSSDAIAEIRKMIGRLKSGQCEK